MENVFLVIFHSRNLLVDIVFELNKRLWFLAKSTGPVKIKRGKVRT